MDKVPKLGSLITDEQHRDAVHIAVAPVTAGERLAPGTRIGFTGDAFTVGTKAEIIGIVDPYLTNAVKEGQMFYMFLLPNTINSLRHEWTHPSFQKEDDLALYQPTFFKLKGVDPAAQKWISDFADSIGATFDELVEAAENYLSHGEYFVKGGTFEGTSVPDEFWDNFERIKRTTVDDNDRGTFLSCSC